MDTLNKNLNGGTAPSHFQLVLSRRAMLALGAMFCVPWLLVAVIFWKTSKTPKADPTSPVPLRQNSRIIEGKRGLWGQLQYMQIATEMPNELAFVISSDTVPMRWFFKGFSKEQTMAVFQPAGLSPNQLASLAKPEKWEITAEGCWVNPGEDIVFGMSEDARSKIYLQLTHFPENKPQRAAFPFYPARLKERLDQSGLSDKSISLFKSLLYRQGPFLLFADLAYALPKLADDNERRRFIKMVSRKSTLLVKLTVDPVSDIERLVGYWGTAGRAKDLHPLLESLAGIEGGTLIDIVHLLPPFARERLYTYPMVSANAPVSIQDCNWTAMNFFNLVPDDRFANMEYLGKRLQEDYYQIGTPERLGDLVFFVLPSGESVHSAVFIADNIVFTKNGESVSQPWILMKLEDMMELYSAPYPSDESLKPLFYRRKVL